MTTNATREQEPDGLADNRRGVEAVAKRVHRARDSATEAET